MHLGSISRAYEGTWLLAELWIIFIDEAAEAGRRPQSKWAELGGVLTGYHPLPVPQSLISSLTFCRVNALSESGSPSGV